MIADRMPPAATVAAVRRRTRPVGIRRAWLIAAVVVLVVPFGLYAARAPLLQAAAGVLVADDRPDSSDFVVMLAGDPVRRPRVAADLMQRGVATRLLLTRTPVSETERLGLQPNRTELQIEMLSAYGVPRSAIEVLADGPPVTSTYDEALAVRRFLERAEPGRRIAIVTGAFGTRRARWVFRRVLDDLGTTVLAVPTPHGTFDQSNWWTSEDGLITVFNEHVKLAMYWVRY